MTRRRPAEGPGFTRKSHDHTPCLLPRLSAQRTPSQRVMTTVAHTFELALGLSQRPKLTSSVSISSPPSLGVLTLGADVYHFPWRTDASGESHIRDLAVLYRPLHSPSANLSV